MEKVFVIQFVEKDSGMIHKLDAKKIKMSAGFLDDSAFSMNLGYVLNYLEALGYFIVNFQKNNTGVLITVAK